MKTRLARKIWNRQVGKLSPYWFNKFIIVDKWDERLTQALRKVVKWESHNSKHRLEKSVRITPCQAKKLRRSVELITFLTDCINVGKQQIKSYET